LIGPSRLTLGEKRMVAARSVFIFFIAVRVIAFLLVVV
jgi:hypothetical protein